MSTTPIVLVHGLWMTPAEQHRLTRERRCFSTGRSRTLMDEVIRDPDIEKAQRAMKAVLGMGKIDIAEVQRAIDQG